MILSSSNSNERFYVGAPSISSKVEARLLAIKPPTLRDQAATTTKISWPLEGIRVEAMDTILCTPLPSRYPAP
ncbi:hypothetical protein MTO96_040811 [Rhipicephalus appendiculatus]